MEDEAEPLALRRREGAARTGQGFQSVASGQVKILSVPKLTRGNPLVIKPCRAREVEGGAGRH